MKATAKLKRDLAAVWGPMDGPAPAEPEAKGDRALKAVDASLRAVLKHCERRDAARVRHAKRARAGG